MTGTPILSVVIPVHNAAAHLARCLAALAASTLPPRDVVVVDDGSSDGSADVAMEHGALVVRVPDGPRGPAAARNLGAARTRGEALLFLDADVAVHADTLARFARCLEEHAGVAAIFGSYDDRPDHSSCLSQYRNLLHHFVHQEGQREAATFWAGCGVVRREAFQAVGGFDERYARPSIEDVDLGARLRAAGYRVWLRPEIQATHLKQWTFAGIVRSDIRDRAMPWTRLIVRQGRVPPDLNTSWHGRASAAAAWTVVGAGAASLAAPGAGWLALAAAAGVVGMNARLYAFFLRRGGPLLALAGTGMHGLYLLYSSGTFAAVALTELARGRGKRGE